MKIQSHEIQAILKALDIILEIKCLIRSWVPDSELNEKELELFKSLLKSLKILLQPLFSKYLMNNKNEAMIELKNEIIIELKKIMKNEGYVLISAAHSKKILKKIGFNSLKLINSGGPLIFSDFLKVNPNLSENVLQGIKRKTTKLLNKLKKIAKENYTITFIYEKQNKTDQIILEEINKVNDLIGQDIFLYELPNWKILEV